VTLLGKYRNLEHDLDGLREQLNEEIESKDDLQRQLVRSINEAHMYRTRYETEGIARAEELEAIRLKLSARLEEAESQIEQLTLKGISLEKAKSSVSSELEAMNMETEHAQALATASEKKQKTFEKVVVEWKLKVDDLSRDVEATRKECTTYSTELFRVKACYDESIDHLDQMRRENKNLSEEIKDLMEQICEGGRNLTDVSKNVIKLEIENEELTAGLEEAETALENEENKVLKGQLELSQVKQEIERRIHQKEEEFDGVRKVHQRAIEQLQHSLEGESKAKAEALRMKGKLESDINELEISFGHANKANGDLHKMIKKIQTDIKCLQDRAMEEQSYASQIREQFSAADRRANAINGELEECRSKLEQTDRSRRQGETELCDVNEQLQLLGQQNNSLSIARRRLEGEMQTIRADLDEMLNEAKASEIKSKKAMIDAARLADELRAEQEHAQGAEMSKKSLEAAVKDLRLKIEETETVNQKGAKRTLSKLESRVVELEAQFDDEARKHADAQKHLRKADRRIKELTFTGEENKKNHERMGELVDKLQIKIKSSKKQIEEAEEIAALNLAKFKKAQSELEAQY